MPSAAQAMHAFTTLSNYLVTMYLATLLLQPQHPPFSWTWVAEGQQAQPRRFNMASAAITQHRTVQAP